MLINSDLTLYNKYIDPTTRTEKYQRAEIIGVTWQGRKAANGLHSGLFASNSVSVFIPFARNANYVQPIAWQALVTKTEKWTLQDGDVIVKGLVSDEITASPVFTMTNLKAKYDNVLVITSVDMMDMGSADMQHWQIGAK